MRAEFAAKGRHRISSAIVGAHAHRQGRGCGRGEKDPLAVVPRTTRGAACWKRCCCLAASTVRGGTICCDDSLSRFHNACSGKFK